MNHRKAIAVYLARAASAGARGANNWGLSSAIAAQAAARLLCPDAKIGAPDLPQWRACSGIDRESVLRRLADVEAMSEQYAEFAALLFGADSDEAGVLAAELEAIRGAIATLEASAKEEP